MAMEVVTKDDQVRFMNELVMEIQRLIYQI